MNARVMWAPKDRRGPLFHKRLLDSDYPVLVLDADEARELFTDLQSAVLIARAHAENDAGMAAWDDVITDTNEIVDVLDAAGGKQHE